MFTHWTRELELGHHIATWSWRNWVQKPWMRMFFLRPSSNHLCNDMFGMFSWLGWFLSPTVDFGDVSLLGLPHESTCYIKGGLLLLEDEVDIGLPWLLQVTSSMAGGWENHLQASMLSKRPSIHISINQSVYLSIYLSIFVFRWYMVFPPTFQLLIDEIPIFIG